jgi:formate hydrogenlyase transcriptional activator
MAMPDSEHYKALFDLSQAIAGHSNLQTLSQSLAGALRRVVTFDSLAVILHDGVHDQLRLNAVSALRPIGNIEISFPAESDHAASQVWRDQRSLVLSPLEDFTKPGSLFEDAVRDGIHALVLLPLSNGSRRLGVLGFGFTTPYDPEPEALAFLGRVASEFAVSVDAHMTRKALTHERDRMRVLFEITTALVSKLPMNELFSEISNQLSRVVAHDFAAVGLLDKATGRLRLSQLHARGDVQVEPEEDSIPPDGLPCGEALATGKTIVSNKPDFERYHSPLYRRFIDKGFRTGCSIPLAGANGMEGVLEVTRKSGEPFTRDDVDLLEQVGRQIAVATENSLAWHELCTLKDKIATEKRYLEDEIRLDQNMGNMIGESPAFQAVLSCIQVVAPTDATVLIEGETGTGKELVARALHDLSGRSKRSFIKVNCAAIPATLLESEMFGHEKGSFTGAFAQKIGRFELAHQGTLFLDEIGEIPLELQSKLLRAIQEQELERLGGTRTIRVDVRFVAATNRSLKQMVDEGKFRSDLYYRLHVFPLSVPPLRERREDIPRLVRYFTQKFSKRLNREIESIPSATLEALTKYDWPGNIRELQNVIERSVILSTGGLLRVALPEITSERSSPASALRLAEAEERERILLALRDSQGKVSGPDGAANLLGLPRTTLQSRMKKLGIEREYH